MKKNGVRRGVRRYKCTVCGHQFQSERRKKHFVAELWYEYVWRKQTLKEVGERIGRSARWVRRHFDHMERAHESLDPQKTVVVADTTFWGRQYGVCVFRAPTLKKNLWWNEVVGERMAHYHYGRKILESKGWHFTAAVVDGRRGLTAVFKDIPVQICQFHQIKQVTKYLTRRPKTDAGKELRTLVLTLTKTDEAAFTKDLDAWHAMWKDFIEEKTVYDFTNGKKKWFYTHKNVRSAYYSLKRNLPYLFTYQKYPHLNIPNTTNCLDGSFSQLKARMGVHRGLRKDRRYKLISEILRGAH